AGGDDADVGLGDAAGQRPPVVGAIEDQVAGEDLADQAGDAVLAGAFVHVDAGGARPVGVGDVDGGGFGLGESRAPGVAAGECPVQIFYRNAVRHGEAEFTGHGGHASRARR